MASAMNESTDQTPPASERSQSPSPSSSSRLCQACLSVLNTAGLELEEYYPHHYSLKDFIEAAHSGCYICSWLFSALSINEQQNLEQMDQGILPESLTSEHTPSITDNNSSPAELYLRYGLDDSGLFWFDKSTSWISFTGMLLRIPIWTSAVQIHFRLNPKFEQYIPPHARAYASPLVHMWTSVAHHLYELQDSSHSILTGTYDGL